MSQEAARPVPDDGKPSRLDTLLDRLEAPPGAWAFALRIWLAMVVALYVAFWLQLESASSAAVCVAILAQPKRGQALSKAFYRMLGTLVGFAVAIALAAAFGQDRVLMLIGFGVWLGTCVFTAQYLQGTRAYGALLSGYTVAIVGIANIDAPQQVFASGVERVAAIAIGIASITFINDALGSPAIYAGVRAALLRGRAATQDYVRRVTQGARPEPAEIVDLVRTVGAPRVDIQAIVAEFSDGVARATGARGTVAASWAEVAAATSFARACLLDEHGEAGELGRRVREGLAGDRSAAPDLERRCAAILVNPDSTPARILLHRRAADILVQEDHARDGLLAADGVARPTRPVTLPAHRDFPDAFRGAIRVVVAYALSAAFFIASGWPATSSALLQLSATASLGAITPSPRVFATGVLIAMPIAVALGGIAKFLVLSGGQGFPLLAITLAPVIVVGCLLSLKPKTFTIGFILIVFFPVALAPSNPQSYDPESYLDSGVLFITAAVLLFACIHSVLPTSDSQRRRWSLDSARAEIRDALAGEPREAVWRLNLVADRLVQFGERRRSNEAVYRGGLRAASVLAALDTAATGAQAALNRLAGAPALDGAVRQARAALARLDRTALEGSARALMRGAAELPEGDARWWLAIAVADLASTSDIVARDGRVLRRMGVLPGPDEESPP